MKNIIVFLTNITVALSLSSCWLTDNCGPFEEGYYWEKKNDVTFIPFYPDSLASDSITINYTDWEYESDSVEVVYSSTLDSFKVTADAYGSNFITPGADTSWEPIYSYSYSKGQMSISMTNYKPKNNPKNTQTPQCSPFPAEHLTISNVVIEAPRTIHKVRINYF